MITSGIVVATNDPQQYGRIKVVCVKWGDSYDTPIEDLPWVRYSAGFGGSVKSTSRGPSIVETEGTIAYGVRAPLTIGTEVLVACLDNDPNTRIAWGHVDNIREGWSTLPHGRYMYEDHPKLDTSTSVPYGPFSAADEPIQPLFDNIKKAFGTNYSIEKQTRGADYQYSNIPVEFLNYVESGVADDTGVIDRRSGWINTQGYGVSRTDEDELEPKQLCFTTPGFHSLSFDDRMENCRVKFRTTTGHQIILDDTNERIYISTAQGENWIEMDQCGNIDVYASRRISLHGSDDINITSDKTVRIFGEEGVDIRSNGTFAVNANTLNLTSELHEQKTNAYKLTANSVDNYSNSLKLTASGAVDIKAGSSAALTTGSNVDIKTGTYTVNGQIQHNSAPAAEASSAEQANPRAAFYPSRIPQHEPWPRTLTKNNETMEPEYSALDTNVNRVERGQRIERGRYWRQ